MRALLLACLIALPLAGCLSSGPPPPDPTELDLEAPEGASIVEIPGGKALDFGSVGDAFEATFVIPQGATMVRLVADPGDGNTVAVAMWNNETGRRRCNQQTVVDFGASLTGTRTCSSLAAIDPPGTEWGVYTGGNNAEVRVEFLTTPPTGPVARLDLAQLSHATHGLEETTGQYVASFDDTPLWVEVTLPEGQGPWPTIISASPYNGQTRRLPEGGSPAMWTYWTQDYAKRGYAAVNVDVRGFGLSGGCVEIWGKNEQRDQAFMVDWVAAQEWSDGNVGFYGQSYVGTTPVEAAVQAPEALKAIIAVAPVINAYEDWHYGGVPNGESTGSPVAYQVNTDPPGQGTDLFSILQNSVKGLCDPTIIALANDPRAVAGDFYVERNFKARAGEVRAATLYTQGFEDANVKGQMIPDWFDAIQAPKLGLYGHWMHQHPARMDAEVLFLGWFDQYLKGRAVGMEGLAPVQVSVDEGHMRQASIWPPVPEHSLGLDMRGALVDGDGSGSARLLLDPSGQNAQTLVFTYDVAQAMPFTAPELVLSGEVLGTNGFLHASITQTDAAGETRTLSWGRINLALRSGYDTYEPATGSITATLPLRPTEHIVAAGSTLTLELRPVRATETTGTAPTQPAVFDIDGAGSMLRFASPPLGTYETKPLTVVP